MEKISAFIYSLVVTLLPVFFLPLAGLPLEVSKRLLFSEGILFALLFWFLSRLMEGKIELPKSAIFWSGFFLVMVYFVSALLGEVPSYSLIGFGHEVGTFLSVALFFGGMLLAALYFQPSRKFSYFYNVLLLLSLVIFGVQVLHLISPNAFSFTNVLRFPNENLVGKWNDLGIFFGLTTLLSLLFLESKGAIKQARLFFYVTLVVGVLGLGLVNFTLIWLLLAIFSLLVMAYGLAFKSDDEGEGVSWVNKLGSPSAIVFLVAILMFSLGGPDQFLGKRLVAFQNKYGIVSIEARPSLGATFRVGMDTLKSDPLFGVGPNRFEKQWRLYKPDSVNETLFWNADFGNGFGIIPSALTTTGILGFLAWTILFLSFLSSGSRAIFSTSFDQNTRLKLWVSFLSGLYLWTLLLMYIPDSFLTGLTFIVTGLFLATAMEAGYIKKIALGFGVSPRLRFLVVFLLVLGVLSSLTTSYVYAKKFFALRGFEKAFISVNTSGNVSDGIDLLNRASQLDKKDIYYRSLSELNLLKLNQLLSQGGVSGEELRSQTQNLLSSAILNANEAIKQDKDNHLNHITLGRAYEAALILKIQGAYEAGLAAYNAAAQVNPKTPLNYLHLARLETIKGDNAKARENIKLALSKKSNFTEAIFLLSQIDAKEGNISAAIVSAEQVAQLTPGDIGVLFQLGLLKYINGDFAGSAQALENAVANNPNYSNALYFLGLDYDKLNQAPKAIEKFERIKVLNPDNEEVKRILRNLYAGRAALSNISPPREVPEKRSTPPIKEDR